MCIRDRYYLASFLDFAGLMYVTASLERLILYLNPTLVVVLGWVLYGRSIRWGQALGMAISYCGVVLVLGLEARLQGADAAWRELLVFLSAVRSALHLVSGGELVQRMRPRRLGGVVRPRPGRGSRVGGGAGWRRGPLPRFRDPGVQGGGAPGGPPQGRRRHPGPSAQAQNRHGQGRGAHAPQLLGQRLGRADSFRASGAQAAHRQILELRLETAEGVGDLLGIAHSA